MPINGSFVLKLMSKKYRYIKKLLIINKFLSVPKSFDRLFNIYSSATVARVIDTPTKNFNFFVVLLNAAACYLVRSSR